MTKWEAYVLGYCYRILEEALGPGYDPGHRKNIKAHEFPWLEFTAADAEAITNGKLSYDKMNTIASAISSLNTPNIEPTKKMSPENCTYWTLAYYRAQQGLPLPSIIEVDLATARKSKNLTQQQLAEQVGVDQAVISRWESGRFEPNNEQLEKLKAILL